jgi:hypothetical protein
MGKLKLAMTITRIKGVRHFVCMIFAASLFCHSKQKSDSNLFSLTKKFITSMQSEKAKSKRVVAGTSHVQAGRAPCMSKTTHNYREANAIPTCHRQALLDSVRTQNKRTGD